MFFPRTNVGSIFFGGNDIFKALANIILVAFEVIFKGFAFILRGFAAIINLGRALVGGVLLPGDSYFVFNRGIFSVNAHILRYIFKRSLYVAVFFGYPLFKRISIIFGGCFRRSYRRYVSAVVYVCRSKQGRAVVIIKFDCAVRSLRSG